MDSAHYIDLLSRFDEARVLVVGDIFLDETMYGALTGVSLEAPVPVYEVRDRRYNPGAAGNVACNLAAMGARTAIVGLVGDDTNGRIVRDALAARGVDIAGVVAESDYTTNTYGKVKAGGGTIMAQEILRVDTPAPKSISTEVEGRIIANVVTRANEVDAIVVIDQAESAITENVLKAIVGCGTKHHLLTVGDSRNRLGLFAGFNLVVPNESEAGRAADVDVADEASLREAANRLRATCKNVLVTRGPNGVSAFAEIGEVHQPATGSKVVDVTAAGDTLTAAATLTMIAGGSLNDAAVIGNAAAGVAVGQEGAVAVSKNEIEQSLSGAGGPGKIVTPDDLKAIMEGHQDVGKKVVWTNGCFDILHAGHVLYLAEAARQGDVLVVGLNSDASLRAVKGPDRPYMPENERAIILAGLEAVDYVTIFDADSPLAIIDDLRPDVYAKGGDYAIDTIDQDERKLVEGYGGAIALLPGIEGQSSSSIIKRARETSG